jgi:hypothetical protein
MKRSSNASQKKESKPKKTRQGKSINTKLSATPSSPKRKAYKGQGK